MSLPFLLHDFDFLFNVYLLTVNIGEPILQEGQTLVWDNLYSESVFHLPFALQGNQTLIHICCDVRMDVQRKSLYLQFVDQVINLTLQSIREKDGWLYATFPEAGGTGFIRVDIHGRTHALAGNLHQSKFTEGQNVMFGSVFLHVLAHTFVQFLPVLC